MIEMSVLLPSPPDEAFDVWTQDISDWWPADRRHTQDPASRIFVLESGRFYERTTNGREVELGRVRLWQRPERLEFDFFPGTGPEHPTHVTVTFVPEGGGTRVTVTHRPTEESRELWDRTSPRFTQSWSVVLAALAHAIPRR